MLTKMVERLMRGEAPVVLTSRALSDIADELGSNAKVAAWLIEVVTQCEKPIGVHVGSDTQFVIPPSWNRKRQQRFLVEVRPWLEQAFGTIEGVSEGDGPD